MFVGVVNAFTVLTSAGLSRGFVWSAASTLTVHSTLSFLSFFSLSSGYFHVSSPFYNLSLSYCPLFLLWHSFFVLCSMICMQPSSAAFWHLSAIIWSGNCYVCLGLCFCLLVCPPCAFCAQHPKAGPLPIFHCTALPFTLGEVIIWSPARFVHLLTCKEIQSLIL